MDTVLLDHVTHDHNIINIASGNNVLSPQHLRVELKVMINERHIFTFEWPLEISDPFFREVLRDSKQVHFRRIVPEWEVRSEPITVISGVITSDGDTA